MKNLTFLLILFIFSNSIFSHNNEYNETARSWIVNNKIIKGSYLMYKNDSVFIEQLNHKILSFPIVDFSLSDKQLIKEKINYISHLNKEIAPQKMNYNEGRKQSKLVIILALIIFTLSIILVFNKRLKFIYRFPLYIITFCIFLFSFTNPVIIKNAFLPFAPDVNTFWDNTYFYVESKAIPNSHEMMVGISNHGWQQQVPIPQCYVGANAWSIPLNPVMATNPIPVDQVHFTRGAIAIAVNGVPIFNPYTNTGADAFLDGQLDNYGGHSGRGDDYHYHTAPLHLYNQTTSTLPIAYAFDGFAVYGNLEPDGTTMTSLDANHGHNLNGEYHYHGTINAPYMIAKMAGVVTEDATHQLIPQAAAHPVRTENWTPLNGALITSCTPNGTSNGYNLTYSLNGISGYATNYIWNGPTYTFNYVTPANNTQTNYNGFTQCNVPLALKNLFNTENILVYPNPFKDKINLTSLNADDEYTLTNNLGQIIYSGKLIQNQDFSNLTNGVYFLKNINSSEINKLIKQ